MNEMNIGIEQVSKAPTRGWVDLVLQRGDEPVWGFYVADWNVGFVAKIDESDNVTLFSTHPIQTDGWKARISFSQRYGYDRWHDGEYYTWSYNDRPMVFAEGEAVKPVAGEVVEIDNFRFSNLYDYRDSAITAAVWFRLCELAGREPIIFHIPNIYKLIADPSVIREDRFVVPKRKIVQKDGVPLYELVIRKGAIVQNPLHRTFVMQDGTKVQIFINVLSWKWPRLRSQRGRTWVERWEQRYAWRLEAMVANWRGEKKPPDVVIPEKREWHSFTDPWVLKEEPQRIWWPLLDLVNWLFDEMPADQVQLVLEDGTQVPVLQEISEPAWDRPPSHQLSHEEIEGGVPKVSLTRTW